jgi:hypothetical protein
MEAAFPFLAIIVGATLLLEHLSKMREEGAKLTESQVQFGTTVSTVLGNLDAKLLEAGIRTDELNHNHLAALNKQLELIDHQSMNELVQAFNVVSKAADVTFAQLKTSWYQFGAGSAGAMAALENFKTEYESLLAQGKDKEANDLLAGTLKSAQRVLDLQKQAKANQMVTGTGGTAQKGDYNKFEEAKLALQKQGIAFTDKEVAAQESLVGALQAQVSVEDKIAALKAAQKSNAGQVTQDKIGGDQDKAARAQAQAARQEAEEKQKAWEANYREAVAALQENERLKIDATKQGSAARLAAIDSAIKEEESKGLQDTGFYRGLLAERVNIARQMNDEEKKLKAEAGKEAADVDMRMGELANAAKHAQAQLSMSAMRNSEQARIAEEQRFANEDFALKSQHNAKEIAALDQSGKEYENKLKALQDKQTELVREHENQITQIRNRAEEERNARTISAENHMDDAIARSLSGMLSRHESAAKMMIGLGDQIAAGMMETAIKSVLANDFTKESDAAAAARKAYLAGMHFPFPVNIVMGPALAAMAFASVMAFQEGGLVPGNGTGDIVPARLEPGETVLTKRLTDGLTRQAQDSNSSGGSIHVHHSPTYHVNTIDGDGIRKTLTDHKEEFAHHVQGELRKLNR